MMDSINLYNVTQNVTVTVGDGYQAKNMYYYQDNVPYSLWVSGLSDYLDPSTFPATCAALNGQTTGLMAVSRMAVPRFNSLQQFIDCQCYLYPCSFDHDCPYAHFDNCRHQYNYCSTDRKYHNA
ncbi:hypothetical protein G6F68_015226 [Rhizopus microsporus]|nr:hypothetical protein G6F68_015226 [Rhizopus microsporus]